jgi:Tetracyclin repressor-like, C-terminal domain
MRRECHRLLIRRIVRPGRRSSPWRRTPPHPADLQCLQETRSKQPRPRGVDLSPVTAAGDWRERLIKVLWSYTSILFGQPGLAQSVLVTRPSGPAYLSLAEGILALLAAGGVRADRAAWAVDLLLHFATSTAAEQGTRERAIDAHGEEEALVAALRAAPADTSPHLAAVGAEQLVSGSGPDRLRWGFDVLLNGILQTPRPEPGTTPGA